MISFLYGMAIGYILANFVEYIMEVTNERNKRK